MSLKTHYPLEWIKKNLIFLPACGPKLKGHKIGDHILDFQEEVIREALDENGNPKKNIFMGYSRKIAKSSLFSWILTYLLVEKEGFSSVIMASTFTQSDIIFSLVANQLRFNPKIKESDYKVSKLSGIRGLKNYNSLFKVFSKSSSNLGMMNISCLCGDEIGAMQSRENLNSILSGLSMAQTKPLLMFASNRPEHPSHWSTEYLNSLENDPSWAFFNYSADMRLDPYSEEAKSVANPFYKEYKKTKNPLLKGVVDFVDSEAESAKRSAENLVVYRRFQLGQPVSALAYKWVDVKDIKIVDDKVFEDKDLRAVLAFDLALSRDFCCCMLILYNNETEKIYLKPFLHIANLSDRRPSQKVLFENWNAQGYITIQKEKAIDRSLFIAEIKKFLKEKKISYEAHVWDRNLATGWTEEFGTKPELYKGTASELSHSIRFVEARSKEGKLSFIGENPCLKWMFDCVVASEKSKSYLLLNRVTTRDSIDGAVATVLGMKYFIEHKPQGFHGFVVI